MQILIQTKEHATKIILKLDYGMMQKSSIISKMLFDNNSQTDTFFVLSKQSWFNDYGCWLSKQIDLNNFPLAEL